MSPIEIGGVWYMKLMRLSKTKIKVFSALTGVLLVLGSYQNCALHQSDGRKQLDKMLSRQSSTRVANCLPYLSQFDGDIVFGEATDMEITAVTSIPSCKLIAPTDMSGAEIAVCTLIQNPNLQVLPASIGASNGWTIYNDRVYYYKSSTEYVDKAISDTTTVVPSGEDRFYGVGVQNGSYINYHFVGANANMGIECRFSVDKSQFDLDASFRQELARRGASLVHKLDEVCNMNGNCSF